MGPGSAPGLCQLENPRPEVRDQETALPWWPVSVGPTPRCASIRPPELDVRERWKVGDVATVTRVSV